MFRFRFPPPRFTGLVRPSAYTFVCKNKQLAADLISKIQTKREHGQLRIRQAVRRSMGMARYRAHAIFLDHGTLLSKLHTTTPDTCYSLVPRAIAGWRLPSDAVPDPCRVLRATDGPCLSDAGWRLQSDIMLPFPVHQKSQDASRSSRRRWSTRTAKRSTPRWPMQPQLAGGRCPRPAPEGRRRAGMAPPRAWNDL